MPNSLSVKSQEYPIQKTKIILTVKNFSSISLNTSTGLHLKWHQCALRYTRLVQSLHKFFGIDRSPFKSFLKGTLSQQIRSLRYSLISDVRTKRICNNNKLTGNPSASRRTRASRGLTDSAVRPAPRSQSCGRSRVGAPFAASASAPSA